MLRVLAAHGEVRRCTEPAIGALAAELLAMADWLGLNDVAIAKRGDLCGRLSDELRMA